MNDKDIWKWIFETMPESEILDLAKKLRIKVPGFRQITWKSQFKLLKPRLIAGLLEPLMIKEVKENTKRHLETCDECFDFLRSTEEMLSEKAENQETGRKILKVLLASVEEDKQKMAQSLFNTKIKDLPQDTVKTKSEAVKKVVPQEKENLEVKSTENMQKGVKLLETQLKKKENKIQELQKQSSKAENELKKEREKWEKEKRLYLEQIKQLKQEVQNRESHWEKQTKQEVINQKQIDELNKKLEEKQDEINHLHALRLTLQAPGQVAVTVEKPKKSIALIGNARSLETVNCYSHNPIIIEPKDIDEMDEAEQWSGFEEIHVISFELTSGRLRKLKKLVPNETLKQFKNIHELITYVDKMGV